MLNTPTTTTFDEMTITLQDLLVVKIGGGAGLDTHQCVADVAMLARQRPVVVVHGVSAAMDSLCATRGVPVRVLTSPTGHSSRYTDPQTRAVFVEAAAQVNRELVAQLGAYGVVAVGFDGDDTPIMGERKAAIRAVVDGRVRMVRDDYSGAITGVDAASLWDVLEAGGVPVLPPLAVGGADGLLNIDGDRASAAVAGALGAVELVILSNVRGLYRAFPDEASFVPAVAMTDMPLALDWAQGRMKRKVLGAAEALESGVRRVVIADGRAENPIQHALNGVGTAFIR